MYSPDFLFYHLYSSESLSMSLLFWIAPLSERLDFTAFLWFCLYLIVLISASGFKRRLSACLDLLSSLFPQCVWIQKALLCYHMDSLVLISASGFVGVYPLTVHMYSKCVAPPLSIIFNINQHIYICWHRSYLSASIF